MCTVRELQVIKVAVIKNPRISSYRATIFRNNEARYKCEHYVEVIFQGLRLELNLRHLTTVFFLSFNASLVPKPLC